MLKLKFHIPNEATQHSHEGHRETRYQYSGPDWSRDLCKTGQKIIDQKMLSVGRLPICCHIYTQPENRLQTSRFESTGNISLIFFGPGSFWELSSRYSPNPFTKSLSLIQKSQTVETLMQPPPPNSENPGWACNTYTHTLIWRL